MDYAEYAFASQKVILCGPKDVKLSELIYHTHRTVILCEISVISSS